MSPKPRRSYSSAGRSDEVATTEGITFDLDGVTFTCHGHLSAFDLAEFAGPVADAPDPENVSDPGVLRILSDFLRALMGQQTYIAFTAHRRKHRTPDEVVQQILFDLVEDVTSRPFPKPSPLRPGLPAPAPSPDASPSPAGQAAADAALAEMGGDDAADPSSWLPDELTETGDVVYAAPAQPRPDPELVNRTLSFAHPERGVRIEEPQDD